MRQDSPEAVIAFFANDDEFDLFLADFPPSVKNRLSHFYRLRRNREIDRYKFSADLQSLTQLLESTTAWHANYVTNLYYLDRYYYDVAISFAGEDRASADTLAHLLKLAGMRVFYDDFEQASLWGKDLFTTLYDVYAHRARYCIMLVSKSYVEKRWTVHERRAAQERVLNERDNAYLLPVRLDNTPVPGLPITVAYLDASIGMEKVADIFVRKLAENLASRHGS